MATYDLTTTTPSTIQTGDILNCPYSGTYKSIALPKGTYKLECWGGAGGIGPDGSGNSQTNYTVQGLGGYATGILNLSNPATFYLYVGGQGSQAAGKNASGYSGGFNGGGSGGVLSYTSSATNGSGGGGASDIRIGQDSFYARVIVAGGGGGVSWVSSGTSQYGGAGGGVSGIAASLGQTSNTSYYTVASPGTQTNGGSGGIVNSTSYGTNGGSGSFGQGGNGSSNSSSIINSGAGGGGGWYGGGAGYAASSGNQGHGAGGSGYVYTSSTASNYPSGCLLNSSYYLADAQTIAGNISFTSPTGTSEIGHSGNGYVRITVIEAKNNNITIYSKNLNTLPSGYVELEYIQTTGSQYINTEVIPNDNIGFDATLEVLTPLASSPYYNLFGARGNDASGGSSETQNLFRIDTIPVDSNTGTELKFGTTIYNSGITGSGKIHIELRNKVYTKPDGSKIQLSGSITNTYPIYIGCLNKENSAYGNKPTMKIYNFKLYNGNTMVRDFIPALRNSDKKTGLYDVVNNKFYTDAAGGNFTCNNVKDPQCVAYLNGEYLTDQSNSAISVQNNGITLSSEQLFNGKNTLKCSGSAYMYVPFPTTYTGDITIECWIYQTSNTNSTYPTPYTLLSNGSRGLYLHQNASWTYCATSSSGGQLAGTGKTPKLNQWVHLMQCLSGTTVYCFVDGVLTDTIAGANTNYAGLTIGTLSDSASSLYASSCYWQGYIGEIKVSKGCKSLTTHTPQVNPFKDYSWKSNGGISFKKPILPAGYKRLEYIESSGTQYINTGYIPDANTKLKIKFSTSTAKGVIIGSDESYKVKSFMLAVTVASFNTGSLTLSLADGNIHSAEFSSGSVIIDNVNKGNGGSGSFTSTYPIYIFSNNRSNAMSEPVSMRLYECALYSGATVVHNFIPCSNPSGEVGLYDTVNSIFYFNSGTGTFTSGLEISNYISSEDIYIKFNPQSLMPSGYTALDYIKCEGAQYINTQFIPTGNTRVLLDFETDTSDSQALFCGGRTAASGSDKQTFTAFYSVSGGKTIRRDYYGTSKTSTTTYDPGRILFDANKNKTYVNGNLDSVLSAYTLATSTASVMPIVLFTTCNQTSSSAALTLSNSNWAKYKVYSCKIWDNNVIQRNLIPAKNSSGTLGLYDTVNNVFYINAGTGTFTAGPTATASWIKIENL